MKQTTLEELHAVVSANAGLSCRVDLMGQTVINTWSDRDGITQAIQIKRRPDLPGHVPVVETQYIRESE